jgi:hypothetical protein
MHVFELDDPDSLAPRTHPWSGSLTDPAHRHYDLRGEPGLIRTVLEDWRPWEQYPATETFYRLVEWLNGPRSVLETSDCAFSGPTANESPAFAKALQCSGRLMLLFRDLPLNTDAARVNAFTNTLARGLAGEDAAFGWGVFGVTQVPVRFTTLPGMGEAQLGSQVMLSLWAWGDDEAETMANLDRTLGGLSSVLRAVGV